MWKQLSYVADKTIFSYLALGIMPVTMFKAISATKGKNEREYRWQYLQSR